MQGIHFGIGKKLIFEIKGKINPFWCIVFPHYVGIECGEERLGAGIEVNQLIRCSAI